jgi:hypothetical protein
MHDCTGGLPVVDVPFSGFKKNASKQSSVAEVK